MFYLMVKPCVRLILYSYNVSSHMFCHMCFSRCVCTICVLFNICFQYASVYFFLLCIISSTCAEHMYVKRRFFVHTCCLSICFHMYHFKLCCLNICSLSMCRLNIYSRICFFSNVISIYIFLSP